MLNQYQDVFRCLQKHDVKYVVIGGIAAVLHGVPRATFDLDLLIEATSDNAQRLLNALLEAKLGTAGLTTPERVLANEITIFRDRLRIDVQTKTPGLEFASAWNRKQIMVHHQQEFFVLDVADLIVSKKATARDVDLSDVRALEAKQPNEEATG